MNYATIAWVDMRANLAIAMGMLIIGSCVIVLLTRRKDEDGESSPMWIPIASLVAGPVIAFGVWSVDVLVLNSDMYPIAFQGDALATLSGVLILGAIVGVVVSVALAIVLGPRHG